MFICPLSFTMIRAGVAVQWPLVLLYKFPKSTAVPVLVTYLGLGESKDVQIVGGLACPWDIKRGPLEGPGGRTLSGTIRGYNPEVKRNLLSY